MKNKLILATSLIALCAVVPVSRHLQAASAQEATADATAATHYGSWGFDLTGMDKSVKPGDDWFSFVNGTWVKNTQIPADRSSYGAFAVLRDLSDTRLRKLVESYQPGDTAHADRANAQPRPRACACAALNTWPIGVVGA